MDSQEEKRSEGKTEENPKSEAPGPSQIAEKGSSELEVLSGVEKLSLSDPPVPLAPEVPRTTEVKESSSLALREEDSFTHNGKTVHVLKWEYKQTSQFSGENIYGRHVIRCKGYRQDILDSLKTLYIKDIKEVLSIPYKNIEVRKESIKSMNLSGNLLPGEEERRLVVFVTY